MARASSNWHLAFVCVVVLASACENESPSLTSGSGPLARWSTAVPARFEYQRYTGAGPLLEVVAGCAGNIVITGAVYTPVDFGTGRLVPEEEGALFVLKLDPEGHPLWGQLYSAPHGSGGTAIACDREGNVWVQGNVVTAWNDFAGDPIIGGKKVVVLKLAPDGTRLGEWHFGTSGFLSGAGLVAHADGSVSLALNGHGALDLGQGPLPESDVSDLFVVTLDASGTVRGSRRFGGQGHVLVSALATDGTGALLLAGDHLAPIDFGLGPLPFSGKHDAFVVKLDHSLSPVFARAFGSSENDSLHAAAFGPDGSVLVSGSLGGRVELGNGALAPARSGFLLKLSASGETLWSVSNSKTLGSALAVNAAGEVLVAGGFTGQLDFGGGPLISQGTYDVFVARFSADGQHVSSRRFGSAEWQVGRAAAFDAAGNALVAGYFADAIDFGAGRLTATGPANLFIAAFPP